MAAVCGMYMACIKACAVTVYMECDVCDVLWGDGCVCRPMLWLYLWSLAGPLDAVAVQSGLRMLLLATPV